MVNRIPRYPTQRGFKLRWRRDDSPVGAPPETGGTWAPLAEGWAGAARTHGRGGRPEFALPARISLSAGAESSRARARMLVAETARRPASPPRSDGWTTSEVRLGSPLPAVLPAVSRSASRFLTRSDPHRPPISPTNTGFPGFFVESRTGSKPGAVRNGAVQHLRSLEPRRVEIPRLASAVGPDVERGLNGRRHEPAAEPGCFPPAMRSLAAGPARGGVALRLGALTGLGAGERSLLGGRGASGAARELPPPRPVTLGDLLQHRRSRPGGTRLL